MTKQDDGNKAIDGQQTIGQQNTQKQMNDTNHTVSESADKIVLKTSVKRGSGTRDQDKLDVKVKGNNPDETAQKLAETLAALEENGVADTLRETQPEQ